MKSTIYENFEWMVGVREDANAQRVYILMIRDGDGMLSMSFPAEEAAILAERLGWGPEQFEEEMKRAQAREMLDIAQDKFKGGKRG